MGREGGGKGDVGDLGLGESCGDTEELGGKGIDGGLRRNTVGTKDGLNHSLS